MIEGVKALGLETCVTLGMLTRDQAKRLAEAGLASYNPNLDTSPEHYAAHHHHPALPRSPRHARLAVRSADIPVCYGGIVGMGESLEDRIGMITTSPSLPEHRELDAHQYAGAGRGHAARRRRADRSTLEFVRVVAVARITMHRPRLSGSLLAVRT